MKKQGGKEEKDGGKKGAPHSSRLVAKERERARPRPTSLPSILARLTALRRAC